MKVGPVIRTRPARTLGQSSGKTWLRPFAAVIAGAGLAVVAGCAEPGIFLPGLALPSATPGPAPALSGDTRDGSEQGLRLTPVRFEEVPGWKADVHKEALPAFLKSCALIRKQPETNRMGKQDAMGRIADWVAVCKAAQEVRVNNPVAARYFFESRFQAYATDPKWQTSGLFTGYYEAELQAAFGPDARYRYPVLSRPKDLIGADLGRFDHKWNGEKIAGRLLDGEFVPYYTRAEIERGVLNGRQLEILWSDNPVDVFFLHIQGSGRATLADGTFIRLAYAGRNGHRYTPVGRELVAAGLMEQDDVTMPAIRDWMAANPVAADSLRKKNRSFIFFRISDTDRAVGAQGAELTPGRSLAVDPAHIPYGVPLWLVTTDPGTKPKIPLRRLVIAQDTGAAIKGPVRGDLFWGHGQHAATKAGLMKEKGTYFLLLPKSAIPPPPEIPAN